MGEITEVKRYQGMVKSVEVMKRSAPQVEVSAEFGWNFLYLLVAA